MPKTNLAMTLFWPYLLPDCGTQADQTDNASTNVSEKTSNKLPLPPGHDRAHFWIEAEESKVKYDHSYAMQPPPYVIFPTYEDGS